MKVVVLAPASVPDVLVRRALAWGEPLGDVELVRADEPPPGSGPTLYVWADTPMLGAAHAAGLRADVEAGADVVAGAALDGGVYLLFVRDAAAGLLGLGFPDAVERARELGLEMGMLRHERRLRRPEDVRALLADPLLPDEVRAVLSLKGQVLGFRGSDA